MTTLASILATRLNKVVDKLQQDPEAEQDPLIKEKMRQLLVLIAKLEDSLDMLE